MGKRFSWKCLINTTQLHAMSLSDAVKYSNKVQKRRQKLHKAHPAKSVLRRLFTFMTTVYEPVPDPGKLII